MSMKTKSQVRAHLRHLDNQFPTEDLRNARFSASRSEPSLEMASVREYAASGQIDNIDLSDASWMLPCNRRIIQNRLRSEIPERFNLRDPAEAKELADMIQAGEADPVKAQAVAGYRQFVVTSDILAMPFALGAFQSVNLSANELPQIITPKARQFFSVRYLGQDGGSRQDSWRTTRKATEVDMYTYSTDRIEYPLIDIQQGDVSAFDTINQQLRYDMEIGIDVLARASLDAGIMNSGIRSLLNIHPKIDQTNIPDSNYLDLTGASYGTQGVWSIQKIKAVLGLISQWGFNLDPDGPITIQSMIFSPLNARDSWDFVSLVSLVAGTGVTTDARNTILEEQRDSIAKTGGAITNAWGYSWNQQYNPQLSKGRCYVFTNQPVGWFFTKTEYDRVINWSDTPDAIDQNIGQVVMKRVLNFVQPQLWAYRYIVVDF